MKVEVNMQVQSPQVPASTLEAGDTFFMPNDSRLFEVIDPTGLGVTPVPGMVYAVVIDSGAAQQPLTGAQMVTKVTYKAVPA